MNAYTLAFNDTPAQRTQNPLLQRCAIVKAFNRANSQGKRRRFLARFLGHSTQLLSHKSATKNEANQKPSVQKTIALDDIVGSEGRCSDFDNQFWPLNGINRDRWVNVALAKQNKKGLPSIQLIHTTVGYFVRDGHHRLSVARAYGQAMIEAEIV